MGVLDLKHGVVLIMSLFEIKKSTLIKIIIGSLISVTSLTGCSTLNNMVELNSGSDSEMDSQDIAKYARSQEDVYRSLLTLAGLPDHPATTDEWNQFIMAGVQYSNQKCENYLDAVQWAKKGSLRDGSLLGQTGAFTNSIMGVAKASARELAMTAAAFGYGRSAFETFNSDQLAGLESSTIRKLVHDMQQRYLDDLNANQYTQRSGAFNALQGYIRLCLPGNIEAEANNAVRGTKPSSRSATGGVNTMPYITLDANSDEMPNSEPNGF
ncbi:hypothetical protein Thini_3172 [Thiothrix nivea DSM 5205]|uniref:Uncharacterized protein n=2 Tax=Thiothrix nivea TaxID=1031 RepID=A0A656HL01_THINJ|nr:hypothetical protein Thini_3172 [Thiothrix nivea DSM 5205]